MNTKDPNTVSSVCGECGATVTFTAGAQLVKCDHCGAGLAVNKGTRLVRLGCPRCGGNFYYIDGSLGGHCPFCDTSLLVVCKDRVLRHVVRPEAPCPEEAAGATLMLLPFWHLGGLLYAWNIGSKVEMVQDNKDSAAEMDRSSYQEGAGQPVRRDSGPMKMFQGRVVDLSLPDPATSALGITSLRLRGSIFPLEPFIEQHEALGEIVPPRLDHGPARERLLARAVRMGASTADLNRMKMRRTDLTAGRLSLYYYPFWVRRDGDQHSVWDGVSGLAESVATPVEPEASSFRGIFDRLQVIELECGACHEPLESGNHSVILPCPCGATWEVTRDGLVPFEARYARPMRPAQKLAWLPFWNLSAELSYAGRLASTADDLTQVLGILRPPRELAPAPGGSPLSFYVPAYGAMKLPRVDHAARDMTRYQPALEAAAPAEGEQFACFYAEEDARQLAYITWIQILPGTVIPKLRSLRITTGPASLWYVPFEDCGRELVNLLTGLRYDWAGFRGVRH